LEEAAATVSDKIDVLLLLAVVVVVVIVVEKAAF